MNNKELYTHYLKLASIPILGSVLLYLVVSQKTQKSPAPVVEAALEAKVLESKPVVKPVATDVALNSKWPDYQWSDFEGIDPFDRRTLFPELAPVTISNASSPLDGNALATTPPVLISKRLDQLKIQAVFQTPDGVAALVNDRIVKVGDQLEGGAEVVEIYPEHLVVSVSTIH